MHANNTTINPFDTPCEEMEVTELEAALLFFVRTGKRDALPDDPEELVFFTQARARMNERLTAWLKLSQ